ncbi:START-like domain-containing protein [Algoriphagus halophytocola]|uniref:START-like domain-containing protein n=1 Tax=Algoriphagus halophytocola TaxID=2991499 RepID=A0ABY6MLE5_9BACT|nr:MULTISPECIES: START-like domain-containing protein [unclassified Algoriphagus]UZD23506.1 START-like domain-containing protein [Algoriphagus sp. TR-M5]WBL44800.1 START-like domain-containing protein [Algoriphagus sp. TR-M9]
MAKNKFVADYQINASKKIIFQYLSTASGLGEWFADDVRINEDKHYIFDFDNENHYAKLASIRTNSHVKFEFYDPGSPDESDHAYIEFKLEENELTQTMFLKVIDYSDGYDEEELIAIWDGLIGKLKEIIGG